MQQGSAALRSKADLSQRRSIAPCYWVSFLITVFFVILFQLLFGMRYEVNDDAGLSNIASGAFGAETHRLIHISIFIGYALKPFYLLVPTLNWLVILTFALGIFCFAVPGALLIQKFGPLQGMGMQALLILTAGQDFFTRWHYSKYAALFLATGLLLIALDLGRLSRVSALGIALAVLGSMVRIEQLFPIGGLSAVLLLWRFFRLKENRQRLRGILSVAIMLALCFGLYTIDYASYRVNNDEWARYRLYNDVRTEISDYRIQFVSDETLMEAGLSLTDVAMLRGWLFYDEEVFPAERLEELCELMPAHAPLSSTLQATAKNLVWSLFRHPARLMFSTFLLFWLLFSRKKHWPLVLGTLAMLAVIVFYLTWRGRFIERIEYSLLYAAVLFMAPAFSWKKRPTTHWLAATCAMMVIFLIPSYNELKSEQAYYFSTRPPRAQVLETAFEDKEHLYVFDVNLFDAAMGYDVWHARPAGSFSNIVFVESWPMYSPFQEDVLHNYGLENPYRDAIDNPDVYLAADMNTELRESYLQQHYNPDIHVVKVDTPHAFDCFTYITQPLDE